MVEFIWIGEKLFGPAFVSAHNSLTFSPYIISQFFFFSLSYLMVSSLFSDSIIGSFILFSQAFLHLLLILIIPSPDKSQKHKATAVSKDKEHAPM